jgi:hypothetical protein
MANEGKPVEFVHMPMTVEFRIPDTMPLLSSDIFVSQNSNEKGLFYLTFFQSRPPILEEGVPLPAKVPADCIVRLALTPQVTFALIQTLQRNFERWQETMRSEVAKAEGEGEQQ